MIASVALFSSQEQRISSSEIDALQKRFQERSFFQTYERRPLEERVGLSFYGDEQKMLHALETILSDAMNNDYDYLPLWLTKEKVSAMTNPVYKIMKDGEIEFITYTYDKDGKRSETKTKRRYRTIGSGVILKKSEKEQKFLLLTARHVVDTPTLPPEKKDEEGRTISLAKITKHKILMVTSETDRPVTAHGIELTHLCISREADVAFLEGKSTSEEEHRGFSVAPLLGNSDDLAQGQIIYLVGFPFNLTKIYSSGIVLSRGSPYQSWDDTNFYTNATSNPGNSGGPLYALRDGKPELVGIMSWRIVGGEGLHGAVQIKYVKKLLFESNLPDYWRL